MSAAAKRTLLLAASLLALVAVSVVGAAGGAPPAKDREAPSAPQNLRVSAVTQTLVRLAWDPSSDNVAVTGYYVFGDRGKATVDTGLDNPEYTLSGLSCGQSSDLTIVAVDDSQNRSEKATMIVSTAPCTDTLPPATPSGFKQVATSDNAVVLAWNPSADNVGVVGYGVYRNLQRIAGPSDPTVTLAGLICGSSYDYDVDAVDAAGNRSLLANAYVQTSPCPSSSPSPAPSPDTQPPSTPTGLAASSISQSALILSWNPSTDNVQVTGYNVYRDGTKVATPSSPGASQAGLACGTSYTFAVEALDAAGNSSSRSTLTTSTSACSTTTPPSTDTQPPSTPTGLAASSITQSALILSWNPSTDNVQVTGYNVYRDGTKVATPSSPGASQAGLACGTSYTFAVDALDAAGNSSSRSTLTTSTSACSTTTPPSTDTQPPSTPTGLRVSSATTTTASLSWNPSTDNVAVAGYRAYRDGVHQSTTTQPPTTVSGLSCGSAYTFEVDAFDAEGNASNRASVIGSTLACPDTQAPSAPTGVVASSRTATSIALIWNASTDNVGVVGYGLYRAYAATSSSSSTTGIFSGLTCNTNYTLAVDAYDAAGNRSNLTTVMVATTACPDTTPPSAPAGLAASSVTQTGLTLSWTASNDNVGVTGYDALLNGSLVGTANNTSFLFSGLSCGTAYTLGVRARDGAGNTSVAANISPNTAACAIPEQPAGPSPPSAPGTWNLTFNDEFDTLDTSKWVPKFWWNGDTFWPTQELQIYRLDRLSTANSILSMKAERATPPITNFNGHTANTAGENFSWYSGFLGTNGISGVRAPGFSQKFGYFEARIKMPPAAPGFWPAFWMQGVTPNGVNSSYGGGGEIDIMEVVPQNPNRLEMHLHSLATFGASYNSAAPLLGGDYHTYGLDWEPGFIAWYLDGAKVAQYTGTGFDNATPQYMMLNFAVGGANSWPGAPTSATPSPAYMYVDWVRAWSH